MSPEPAAPAGLASRLPRTRPLVDVSLWSADLTALADAIAQAAPHADLFHFDVADGHFVRELVFFPDLVAALRPLTTVPFHAHLMAREPAWLAARMTEAGADLITVHAEGGPQAADALRLTRSLGKAAGLAVTLDSPVTAVLPYLDDTDVIVMTGTPLGTRGTEADTAVCDRITAMRALLSDEAPGRDITLIADGGIRRHTVGPLIAAGADGIVAGSLIFASGQPPAGTVRWIHGHPRHGAVGGDR